MPMFKERMSAKILVGLACISLIILSALWVARDAEIPIPVTQNTMEIKTITMQEFEQKLKENESLLTGTSENTVDYFGRNVALLRTFISLPGNAEVPTTSRSIDIFLYGIPPWGADKLGSEVAVTGKLEYQMEEFTESPEGPKKWIEYYRMQVISSKKF